MRDILPGVPRIGSAILVAAVAVVLAAPVRAQGTAAPDTTARFKPVNLVGMGPNGATLRCRDGSYPAPFAAETACDGKGGVLIRFRVRGTPPAPVPVAATVQGPVPVTLSEPPVPPLPESRANVRIAPPPMPRGTTLMCRNGTFIVADTSALRCASHGGVKVRFPPTRDR